MATEDPIFPSGDNVNTDYRYRGYLYDLQRPRIPITGAIGFREGEKKYPLSNSLVRGHPVLPPTPAKGFTFGSDNIRDLSNHERRENRINLRMLDKTSADLRRQKRQAEEQAEFIRQHKEVRKIQEIRRKKEQEEDLKQLRSYNPFGKPGYGAPRSGNIAISRSLQANNGVGIVIESPTPREPPRMEWNKVAQPGDLGRPRMRRYEDDRMRRYAVDRDTAMAYKKELDELRAIKRKNEENIEKVEKARENEMLTYDPFGKPGAGAPNRDEKGKTNTRRSISLSYVTNVADAKHAVQIQHKERSSVRSSLEHLRPSIAETSKEAEPTGGDKEGHVKVGRGNRQPYYPDERNSAATYDPWEKDLPRIDSKGNARRFPRAGEHGIYEFVDPSVPGEVFPRKHIGGGGEPLLDDNGDILTKRMGNLTTIHGARRSENIPRVATPNKVRDVEVTLPWGKPGAGAPLKDDRGTIVKNTRGTIDKEQRNITQAEASMRARAKEIYRSQLKEGMVMQRNLREEEKEFLMKPPGDVPSWFSKGKVGRPHRDPETGLIQPQKRIMSDVTAQKLAADRPRDVETYYKELKEQADERRKMRQKEKERVAMIDAKPNPYRVVAPWAIDA